MLYMPLSHCMGNRCTPTDVVKYDLERLPLCLHDSFMAQAKSVEAAPIEMWCKELAKVYGIKGIPLLSALGSLRFPQSFPYDFMHLVWENLGFFFSWGFSSPIQSHGGPRAPLEAWAFLPPLSFGGQMLSTACFPFPPSLSPRLPFSPPPPIGTSGLHLP